MNLQQRIEWLRQQWLGLDLSRRRLIVGSGVAILVLGIVLAIVTGGSATRRPSALPPTPPSPVGTSVPAETPTPKVKPPLHAIKCSKPAPRGDGSSPDQICIPSLRVDTSVMQLGLNSDRTVQVPPLSRVGEAGWYKYSAAPGDVGPTVILGHVDSAQYGNGVFFRLGTMHAGDKVVVSRGDGKVATFRVDRLQEISKSRFPTDAVYGTTSAPAIRLVTCGGRFDSATGNYEDNIIAYGTLLSLRSR